MQRGHLYFSFNLFFKNIFFNFIFLIGWCLGWLENYFWASLKKFAHVINYSNKLSTHFFKQISVLEKSIIFFSYSSCCHCFTSQWFSSWSNSGTGCCLAQCCHDHVWCYFYVKLKSQNYVLDYTGQLILIQQST